MERIKFFLYVTVFFILAILVFSLSKSWFFWDKGIKVQEENSKETVEKDLPKIPDTTESYIHEFLENGKIIKNQFVAYPLGLSIETGGSPLGGDAFYSHAKNLIFLKLSTGQVVKIFEKDVYIWDYFLGEFNKRTNYTSLGMPSEETLDLKDTFVIFAVTKDSNKDGFLNSKDSKRIYLFDLNSMKLLDIFPENYYFEKLLYNTSSSQIVSVVRKVSPPVKKKENTKKTKDSGGSETPEESEKQTVSYPEIFFYDMKKRTGKLLPITPNQTLNESRSVSPSERTRRSR